MANLPVKDHDAAEKFLKASGAGSDVDPHVVEHLDTNSAAALTALQAIETAVEGTVTVDLGANNDVTVTGTVDLGATDNAVLDTIDAVLDTINAKLVTGTVIGDVNLGATDNAVLDSIDTATTATQAAVEGTLTVAAHAVTNAGTFATQAAATIADAADVNAGAIADAAVAAGATGSLSAKIRRISTDLDAILTELQGKADVGETQPVSGTVTANLSATDNAVLDTIDAVLDTINAKLVTGTVIGDVNLGATDNAVLDAIAASVAGTLTVDGSGATQPVSGTVTANLGATDNAVLDTIDAAIDTMSAKFTTGTVIGDVNLGATDNAVLDTIDAVLDTINAKLVTGTVIGDVNLGATDNAVLDTIATNTGAAVSGSEMQVDIVTDQPLDRTADNIGAVDDTDSVMQDATVRTVAFDSIDVAGSGDNTLLAAQGAGNKIRVLSMFYIVAAAVNVRIESGAAGTALTGQMQHAAKGEGMVLPYNPKGWFETAANALLNMELSGAVSVDGSYSYVVVT